MAELMEDDSVQYFLFPLIKRQENDDESVINSLEEIRLSYLAHLASYLDEYLWQKDSFNLHAVDKPSANGLDPYLFGITRFGANVEDEWFIVFLLLNLTKAFPNLIVRVIDADGEFLLIEMADCIPKWLNPDTAENRVFLHKGAVHIVPRDKDCKVLKLSMLDAVKIVKESAAKTKCIDKMQECLLERLKGYPDKIKDSRHRAHCFIPAAIAAILKSDMHLVSAAVNAFHERDAIDLKACRTMKYFPPETRVMSDVVFTRCLYAQLMHQKYDPDKRIGWKMPLQDSSLFKPYDLGMKLACGFEILVQNSKRHSCIQSVDDSEPRWLRYVSVLKSKGYFRHELKGSKMYQELLEKAKQHFVNCNKMSAADTAGERILKLLDSVQVDTEELQRQEKSLLPPDDDSWLELTGDQLDEILRKKLKAENESQLALTITENLKSFVRHESDFQGAEFPTKVREKPPRNNKSKRVTLDPDSFGDAMNSILDFHVPEWEEGSSSDMSEYSDEDEENDVPSDTANAKSNSSKIVNNLKMYMNDMDKELSTSAMAQSFERKPVQENQGNETSDLDHYSPVDVDLTALCNILESYRSQGAAPGPASNLLSSMGVNLPQNAED